MSALPRAGTVGPCNPATARVETLYPEGEWLLSLS
jgi:hypothetical protein